MPNGGTHHCGYCCHFQQDTRRCALRDITIEAPFWTSCRNWDTPATAPTGPLYAIVGEVRNGGGSYATIPYWGETRPDLFQRPGMGDTYVSVALPSGALRFESVVEYLEAMQRDGMLPEY